MAEINGITWIRHERAEGFVTESRIKKSHLFFFFLLFTRACFFHVSLPRPTFCRCKCHGFVFRTLPLECDSFFETCSFHQKFIHVDVGSPKMFTFFVKKKGKIARTCTHFFRFSLFQNAFAFIDPPEIVAIFIAEIEKQTSVVRDT